MKIVINEEWFLETDSSRMNIVLYQAGINNKKGSKNFGQKTNNVRGYFGNLGQAYQHLLNESVMQSELEGVKDLQEMIENLSKDFKKSYKNANVKATNLTKDEV